MERLIPNIKNTSGPMPNIPVIEYVDLELYGVNRSLHSELNQKKSFWSDSASLSYGPGICFMCRCTLFKSDKNSKNDYETRMFHRCSDCNMMACDACTLSIHRNLPSSFNNARLCDCYLFSRGTGCDKFLCQRCSFSINSINVSHGFSCNDFTSNYINSNYSYKCFYDLLKKIFYNPVSDKGLRNAIIRILNDFSLVNVACDRTPVYLSGIMNYIKNKEYSLTFAIAMFELSAIDICNLC